MFNTLLNSFIGATVYITIGLILCGLFVALVEKRTDYDRYNVPGYIVGTIFGQFL